MSPAESQQINRSIQEGYRLAPFLEQVKRKDWITPVESNLSDIQNLADKNNIEPQKLIGLAREMVTRLYEGLNYGYLPKLQKAIGDVRTELNTLMVVLDPSLLN